MIMQKKKTVKLSFSEIWKEIRWLLLGQIVILPLMFCIIIVLFEPPVFVSWLWWIASVLICIRVSYLVANGMYVSQDDGLILVSNFRFITLKRSEIERVDLIFSELNPQQYSITVRITCQNGNVIVKNYAERLKKPICNRLTMSLYTVSKRRLDIIARQSESLSFCSVWIRTDKDGTVSPPMT